MISVYGFAASVGDVGLPGYDQATPEQEGIALIFTALAYGIVAILLVFQMLMRLALIDMLIVLSPVAALLWVLPQTQGWFRPDGPVRAGGQTSSRSRCSSRRSR